VSASLPAGHLGGDPIGLNGRVAVVTGGGGSIGAATAVMLAGLGARVLVADLDAAKAERAASAVRDLGGEASAFVCDVRRRSDVDAMAGDAVARWGRIDVGVSIVGGSPGPVVGTGRSSIDLSDDEWTATVELNLYTAVRCARAFARVMLEQGAGGSIVNVASPAALRAAPGMVAYGASKAALVNFTWTLAVELAPEGIRANVVVPAFVSGPEMGWGGDPEEQAALARRVVPMGRMTLPADVAGAIAAFASELTSFSTGQVVVCDGGRLLTNPINPGAGH